MLRFRLALLLVCLGPLAAPATAPAQLLPRLPLSLEFRAGAGIPLGDFAESDSGVGAEPGLAVAAGAQLHLGQVIAVYAEYQRTAFGCSRCAARGIDDEVVAEGGGFGLHATPAFPVAGLAPWLRAGAVVQQLTFTGRGSSLSSETATGFEAGGGVALELAGLRPGLSLTPGVRYRSFSAELDLGGLDSQTVDVNQVVVDLGLAFRF